MKAILFDFDGVIVDSEPLHFESFCEVLRPYGIKLDRGYYNGHYLGYNDWEVLEKVRHAGNQENLTADELPKIVSRKTRWMQDAFKTRPPVLPGVLELMGRAIKENIKLAVFSGALREEVHLTLKTLGIFEIFGSVLAAEDVERGKPDPMGYLLSAERLGVSHDECVVIEDSPIGLSAAKSAGMKTCALTTTYESSVLSAADMVVPNLSHVTLNDLRKLF